MKNKRSIDTQQFAANEGNSIKSTFDLLKDGEKKIELSDKYKDVILVLGNTGAGKSTFTQWIAGNNDKLISKEVAEGTGEFIIEDNNRIGNSTIKSKTVFPELVVDTKANTAYYDCPGFSDTRSVSNDIATTYFIKKVLNHAQSVKLLFIINYPSVRKGVDREDFMKLIRHSTELVKDVNKFKNSIAIIVTKVDNQYVKQGKILTLVEDSKVIGAIADFLQEVKHDLGERVKISGISTKEQKFYDSATKFIDILLVKQGDYYTKIGIFRRPDEPGPLSNITLLQEGKQLIEKILYENLNFTVKNDDDFGYTISEKSKNDINDLVEEINKNISYNLSNIAQKVQEYYHNLVERVCDKIKSFATNHTTIVDVNQSEAQAFSSNFRNGYDITSNLIKNLTNLTNPEELAEKIDIFASLDINLFRDNILDVANQGKYFNFLQIVSDKKLSTRPWAELFKGILPYFSELQAIIENDVYNTAQKINNHLNDTIKAMHKHYYEKMKSLEIQKLPAELKNEQNIMLDISKQIESAETTNELLKTMQIIYDSANSLGISIPMNNITILTNQKKYFNVLQIISNKELTTETLTWICPFKDAVQYLDKSEKWYRFLNDLYVKFSEYEIQKDRSKYNVADLANWGKSDTAQGIHINQNNFQQFLSKTAQYNLAEYESMRNIMVTGLQLEELNYALNSTLKHKMYISCLEPYISIMGNYISITDIKDNIIEKVNTDESCGNLLTDLSAGKFKFAKAFALSTVFIDDDIPIRATIPLAVIAPKWEVIGTRWIGQDGLEGKSQNNSTFTKEKDFTLEIIHGRSKAKDGSYPGANGTDGKPGGAGGPGGTFLGIGEQFINGANLTITANGGIGGSGQDGGNGRKGTNGDNAEIPNIPCKENLCDGNKQINGYNCEKIHYKIGGGEEVQGIGGTTYVTEVVISCEFKVFGKPGGKGGDGGNGGSGGKGGNPGNVILLELGSNSKISKHLNVGEVGKNGTGGIAGDSGNNGDDIIVTLASTFYSNYFGYEKWKLKERIHNRSLQGKNGINGTDGANTKNIEEPKVASIIDELDIAKIINGYKSYLRENLNDRFIKSPLTEFLNKLDSNQNVKNIYNTLGLVDELQGLEEQFHKLNKDVDMLPFYQSLLHRINEYAQNIKEVGDPNQHKKVLSYLYTATLSRICNLQDNFESNLIINITSYLNSVQEDINKLKDLKKAKNKIDIINKYKQEYKNGIDIKIKEANTLISKEIIPEMDNIGTEIDKKIELLINEVIVLQEQSKEKQKELFEKRQQLKRALALQRLFGTFNVLGQVISFLGPLGEVAGSIIGVGSSVAESFLLDNQRNTLQLAGGKSDLEGLQNQIKTIRDQKVIRFKKTLEDISQKINEHTEKLGNVSVKIAEIKDRINKLDEKKINFKEIEALENELKTTLQLQEGKLRKTQEGITDQKTKNALHVIDYCKKAVQLSATIFDTYSKYKNDETELDTINKEIENAEKEFQELKEYEEKIYNTIAPILQNIKNDLDDLASKLGTKSKVALDVTKWQVQSTLGDVELQMQQMTQSMKVKDNLVHCITKLKDGMTTLINVYKHIQDYQKDQNFANYVADISSITTDDINIIVNPELGERYRNAVRNMEITVRSSIVLQRYQVAIDAFKQFVFPFAHIYLKELALPSHLEFGAKGNSTTFENLVSGVMIQIDHIKSKLGQYKESMTTNDGPIGIGEFSSLYDSTQPFFVWKKEQHQNAVSKLLSGQEIIMNADIMNSSVDEEAIKFNTIELNFKTKNETKQFEINNILKGFNISVTHLGNSYYQYDDKIYLMTTNSQDIWYYFEKNNNGEPVHRNIAYDKLKKGDFMLSPYALWKIKLINLRNKHNFSFKDLEKYKDETDLELGGNGYYVNKGGVNEDLMVERYYKAIDIHNHLDVNNKGLNTVPLLQGSYSRRNKREVYQEFEDENIQTIVDEEYQLTQNNQAHAKREYTNTEPRGWFSWMKFPSFNILPGAEAAVIESENLVNQKDVFASLDSITMPFLNGMELLKDAVLSKILKLADNITNSNPFEKINNYTDNIVKEEASNSLNNLEISFDGSKINNMQAITTFDINANLTLGQLVIHKVYGNNKCLSGIHYISPEQAQNIRINKLASEILPVLSHNSLAHHSIKYIADNYSRAPQWFQDMQKDEYDKITSKSHQKKEKKDTCENSSEEIFADSVQIFDEIMNCGKNDIN